MKIDICEVEIKNRTIKYRKTRNEKEGKKCTECRNPIKVGEEILQRIADVTTCKIPGIFCTLQCLIGRQMKSLAKEASKPAEYLLFNYGGVDLKLEVKSFCSTSKRKGGKTKIRTLKYVAVTSPSYLLLCDKCKAKIYPGSTCYHVINKKGKLDTASHCTILCMKEKFGELKKT